MHEFDSLITQKMGTLFNNQTKDFKNQFFEDVNSQCIDFVLQRGNVLVLK